MDVAVDLHQWISADLTGLRDRLRASVIDAVPHERWHEQVDGGGSSITHLLLHLARHHDLAITTAVRNHAPRFAAHRDALGLADAPAWAGLPEREDPAVSAAVGATALLAYLDEVFTATATWLTAVGTMALATIPDSGRRLAARADLPVDDVPWLHRMWADQPVWWLVQWPVLGHGHAHTGEAISVRNRMGLSPF
jgi:hypothetical protein